ncbi:AGR342Cp [Eremothecium gossypii ATCC 10895]|uniref:Nicotinamide riboside kinase n=1 Tax=Eremothecium gossypii (strain ATCC 10895 / CBS 109.51 / FGSC 9923 / NRRL Y-1056) TaxID=284811 RepID=NRK1_EREGS|nr:AGR342Cp [Eremothecium gossypii ATCC 10895]P62511.1 RecName: Full=Nicotinamide riboside kinase; Short=NRK; Short=NmR-K; AltName: Full=Nicotinic acid riboside kinase; AltName: Full=Ribosylnicotinamide kinase; Short=RNK; AltName: Full=Ribosylnicotinic acid kinase [Eremothecium gossypii ATCC 10895]AAS54832.2 AGR342Cp [Eremothecium gossypii ATCC 10895]AEY99164.1 FAGR342Cp [Eremothecium gossypii FDAG1]
MTSQLAGFKGTRGTLLVGIGGCSSSGKSTIAKLAVQVLEDAVLVHQDDFYRHDDEVPFDEEYQIGNWDVPEALDMAQFERELDHIRATGRPAAKLVHNGNIDDVGKFGISEEYLEELRRRYRGRISQPVVLVDGFMLYHDDKVAARFDCRLLVRAPYATMKARRASRGGYKTLDSFWQDPPFYFDKFVYKSYAATHARLFRNCDVEDRLVAPDVQEIYNGDEAQITCVLEQVLDAIAAAQC